MKLASILLAMVILFAVGLRLMFYGFLGLVTSPSSTGQEILGFFAGLICLVAGIVTGVMLLKSTYRL
jgi:hypothetical protein